jgi:hypothetical protein
MGEIRFNEPKLEALAMAAGDELAEETAEDVADTAHRTAPRQTGRLAASHYVGRTARPGGRIIGNTADYAAFVHEGIAGEKRTRPQPWLYEALWAEAFK